MTLKDKIKLLCKIHGTSMNKIEKELGFASGYISKLGNSKPNSEYMNRIAERFSVTTDFLLGNTDISVCSICGFGNNPISESSRKEHEEFHNRFLLAKEKYPFLMPYAEADSMKNKCIISLKNKSLDLTEKIDTYEKYLQAQFSIEFLKQEYDMSKISYDDFGTSYTRSLNLESNLSFSKDFVNAVFEKYHVDKNYMNNSETLLARISSNEQIMRIVRYMEDLKPEHLDALEIQVKVLSEH
jgi:transcriptional regulator with XRE-family HTH domain